MDAHETLFDIIIVGSGFVGSTLACALQSLPLKIALLEQAPPRAVIKDQRSIVLSYGSSRILDTLGLWSMLRPHTVPIQTIQLSDAGHFGMTHLSARDEHVEALGYVIEGGYLQHALTQAVEAIPTLTTLRPAKVIDMKQAANHWCLEVETEQGSRELQAKLIIAADGTHSSIRRLQQIGVEEFDYQQTAIISQIGLHRPHHHVAYERFTPKGAIAFLPLQGLHSGLVWSVPTQHAEAIMQLSDKAFLQQLQENFGYRLGKFIEAGQRVKYPLKLTQTKQQAGLGWILLGNAAHTLHPIAAQGFNLGLRDVACLADLIADALRQQQDLFSETLTKAYVNARARDQKRTIDFTHHLVRMFSHDIWPVGVARGFASTFIEYVPPLKSYVARQAMGVAGRLARLARGLKP